MNGNGNGNAYGNEAAHPSPSGEASRRADHKKVEPNMCRVRLAVNVLGRVWGYDLSGVGPRIDFLN
jgi:hypothetical protein